MNENAVADFAKVRKLIELKEYQSETVPKANDIHIMDQTIRLAVEEAMPIIIQLVDYYFDYIDKTGNEAANDKFRSDTKKEATLLSVFRTGYRDFDPTPDGPNRNILRDAMQHYEAYTASKAEEKFRKREEAAYTLPSLLLKSIGEMTGSEFLEIMREFERRKATNS